MKNNIFKICILCFIAILLMTITIILIINSKGRAVEPGLDEPVSLIRIVELI